MRVAVTIIAGGLTLVIALQSCSAQVGGEIARNEALIAAGDAGWLIALLYLLGAGFAHGVPGLATLSFAVAGTIALSIQSPSGSEPFGFWGVVALVLAAMSAVGWRERRRAVRRSLVHERIDAELIAVGPAGLAAPPRATAGIADPVCPRCGVATPRAARYCQRCGESLTVPPAA